MKNTLILAFLFTISFGAYSQTEKEQIDIIQSLYGMEKKAIVSKFIHLEGEKADAFWDLYDEYETQRKELGLERVDLLNMYAENYMTLDDETTSDLIDRMMKLRKSSDKLVETYVKKIKKAVDVKTAAQFYQIEGFFVSATRSSILENIPVIGELD